MKNDDEIIGEKMLIYQQPQFQTCTASRPAAATSRSFLRPFALTMSWTSARDHGALKERRRKRWGRVRGSGILFSSSKPTLWPQDPPLDLTAPLPLPPSLPYPLDIFTCTIPQHIHFVWDMSQHENGWDKRNMWTRSPHLLSLLGLFFYTLHTSADGLSIDFDLPFLSSSVNAYVRWGLYDNFYPPICSYLKTLLAWLSKYE